MQNVFKLSRGKPLKYASSNRIASYMGMDINFINEKLNFKNSLIKMNGIYKDEDDLISKFLN